MSTTVRCGKDADHNGDHVAGHTLDLMADLQGFTAENNALTRELAEVRAQLDAATSREAMLREALERFVYRHYREVHLGDHNGWDGGFITDHALAAGRAALTRPAECAEALLKLARAAEVVDETRAAMAAAFLRSAEGTIGGAVLVRDDEAINKLRAAVDAYRAAQKQRS